MLFNYKCKPSCILSKTDTFRILVWRKAKRNNILYFLDLNNKTQFAEQATTTNGSQSNANNNKISHFQLTC